MENEKKVETVEKKRFSPKRLLILGFCLALMVCSMAVPAFATTTEPAADIGLTEGISVIGEFFTALLGWLGSAAQFLITNWVIVIFVLAIPVAGWIFSLLFRLIGRGRRR